jgi:CelD/BcsL family acetyltransferase involved in cellulose biosynthesis
MTRAAVAKAEMHPEHKPNDNVPRGSGVPMSQTVLVAPESEKGSGSGLPVVKAMEGGIEIIDGLAEEWRQLCLEGPSDQPFYRPEWIAANVRAFAPKAKLLVVTARVDGRLRAVLPLIYERTLFCGLPVRRLRGAASWGSLRFDLIRGCGEEGDSATLAIWEYLKTSKGWDVVELPDVPQGGAAEQLLGLAQKDHFAVGRWESKRSAYMLLTGLGDGKNPWLSCTSAKFRQNMRYQLRKAEAKGPLRLIRLEGATPDALARFYDLEASGWKGREGTAIACKPRNRRFFDEVAQVAGRFGYLCLHFLEAGGDTLAASFGLVYGSKYFALKWAYNESYDKCGPGHLLINAIIGDCVQRQLTEFDFMGERFEYETKWTSEVRSHSYLYVFRSSLYGRVLHAVKFSIVPSLKKMVARETRVKAPSKVV